MFCYLGVENHNWVSKVTQILYKKKTEKDPWEISISGGVNINQPTGSTSIKQRGSQYTLGSTASTDILLKHIFPADDENGDIRKQGTIMAMRATDNAHLIAGEITILVLLTFYFPRPNLKQILEVLTVDK